MRGEELGVRRGFGGRKDGRKGAEVRGPMQVRERMGSGAPRHTM